MKIGVLQMTAGTDPALNTTTLTDAIAAAAAGGAVMLFTPEMSGMLDRDRDRAARSITDEASDQVLRAVRDAAARSGVWVSLGSLAIRREDGRLANRSFVIDGSGDIRTRYDKLHLFDVDLPDGESWRESSSYIGGEVAVAASTPVGLLGLSICYDVRFASLYEALSTAGAEVIAIPAAFTVPTGEAHWHVLLRARAIESAAFVVAAAQTGTHADGRSTYGHSMVVDPWGEVVLDMGMRPGLSFVDLQTERVADIRSRVPAIRHRRPIPAVSVMR